MKNSNIKICLDNIQERIDVALKRSGRTSDSIKLIAVSKKKTASDIREAHGLGVMSFGENYVQEFLEKSKLLTDLPLEWHFIGQLQTNKVRDVVGQFEYIHSVDRLKLAEKIASTAEAKGIRQKVLIELNLAGEESKGGVREAELLSLCQSVAALPSLELCGLMLMPPPEEDAEKLRPYFKKAHELLLELREKLSWNKNDKVLFKELSMGTSQDFHVAIEEGATMVRLGTILFGARS